jgi:hypothetical protein
MSTYLIVADRSAWSMGLARKLDGMERDATAEFVIIVPADPTLMAVEPEARLVAEEAAARARTSLRQQGLTVLEAIAGPPLPRKALEDELNRGTRAYDGIIVGASRRNPGLQIQADLVIQLERKHGIPVRLITLRSAVMT